MKKFLGEFKEFAMRGNVMDLAIGVVIGAAFGKIVSSLVSDIITPAIGVLLGGVNFTDIKIILKQAFVDGAGKATDAVTLNIGTFLQSIFDFIIIAFVIFLIIKLTNRMKRTKEKEEKVPVKSDEVLLLVEIRDLLKK